MVKERKEIVIMAAISANNVIGNGKKLPWKLSNDMKLFTEMTMGNTVIMGRKTWETIPPKFRPLPGRRNIVITRTSGLTIEGAEVFNDIHEAIGSSTGLIYIIGGAEIYKMALEFADNLVLTHVHAVVEGDVFFPDYDRANFLLEEKMDFLADDKNQYAFSFCKYSKTFLRKM